MTRIGLARSGLAKFRPTAAGIAFALLAAGCGRAADDPAQGGVSAREAEALNDAAAMLDDNGSDAVIVTNADEGAGNVE